MFFNSCLLFLGRVYVGVLCDFFGPDFLPLEPTAGSACSMICFLRPIVVRRGLPNFELVGVRSAFLAFSARACRRVVSKVQRNRVRHISIRHPSLNTARVGITFPSIEMGFLEE